MPGRSVVKSLLVGLVATGVDLAVLAALVELCGVAPTMANVPSLLAGAAVQFLGCRYFAFPKTDASVFAQLLGFAAAEAGTLTLNGIAFFVLVKLSWLPYVLARPVATFVVFVAFSYPAWKRVFSNERTVRAPR